MAYREFSENIELRPIPWAEASASSASDKLGTTERQVLQLAAQDSLASLNTPPRSRRLLRFLFGTRPNNQLADMKLEALRGFAVLVRHGRDRPHHQDQLREAGFSAGEIAEARRLASPRDPAAGLDFSALGWLASIAIVWTLAFFWVLGWIADPMIAAALVTVIGLPLATLVNPRRRAR